jgi:uncharacterized protein (TIGR00269 family)
MKCRVCRAPAIIDVPRHNANFCAGHFLDMCRKQVRKAIDDFDMLDPHDRILVAVSGGKDSLAIWDMLIDFGYQADGLYVGLGIGDYSDVSGQYARAFASERGLTLIEISLRDDYGYDIPTATRATRRVPCSACGLSKRHLFDKAALDGNYSVLVTGHNLDDEAAVLYGNTLRWELPYLARQLPTLAARDGFPKKVKPLVRLSERETAAWCVVRGIDYLVDECPMAAGNRHLGFKEALNKIESQSPGTKTAFYLNFVEKVAPLLSAFALADDVVLAPCSRCAAPTTGEICAFCHLVETSSAHEPVPVQLVTARGGRRR